jgi:hypothetical protein
MVTRASGRIIIKGKILRWFIHGDGYLEGVGAKLVCAIKQLLKDHSLQQIADMISKLKVVDWDMKPTEEEKQALHKYGDQGSCFKERGYDNYYDLLYQNNWCLLGMIESGYFTYFESDDNEYVYTLDFDRNIFLVHGVMLDFDKQFPLDAIPEQWIAKAGCNEKCCEEYQLVCHCREEYHK